MRLKISESKNSKSFYVIKSVYDNGYRTTIVFERLGTEKELAEKLDGRDPEEWAREYIAELNRQEKEDNTEVIARYSPSKRIPKGKQVLYNGGYLFLQKIYFELRLNKLCSELSKKYKFEFNLDSILSRLLYARIIYPASKHATYKLSKRFIEQPDFKLHHIYRSLGIIAKESDLIQTHLYKSSLDVVNRDTGILYYDCTNFYFEIEQEEGIKQYGFSKEHRPNPITQMGLFMDGSGIPLAFVITAGNQNEQPTMKPLEKKILKDFELTKFVVCTDAGLASTANRKFNDISGRAFVTTQSVKKLKAHLKKWALDPNGWSLADGTEVFNINEIDEEKYKDDKFYKERWIKEDELEQRLVISYSIKYRNYQNKIRSSQIDRAVKLIKSNPKKVGKVNQNDYKRFISKTSCTQDGEAADVDIYKINTSLIEEEAIFDGFYGVCTNLEDNVSDIIKITERRWEIEECFRIMKHEFKARPVDLRRDDRIEAHFATCFIALQIYRIVEKKLNEAFTCNEIISTLRNLNFYKVNNEGYVPAYERSDITDALHEAFGFRTDYEVVKNKKMKNILKESKK